MPTMSSSSTETRPRLAAHLAWRQVTAIWLPTVNTGSSEVIGSWKTMAISRRGSTVAADVAVDQRRALPAHVAADDATGSSIIPSSAWAVTLLPEPDSPTSPRVALADREADVADGVDRPRRVAESTCR